MPFSVGHFHEPRTPPPSSHDTARHTLRAPETVPPPRPYLFSQRPSPLYAGLEYPVFTECLSRWRSVGKTQLMKSETLPELTSVQGRLTLRRCHVISLRVRSGECILRASHLVFSGVSRTRAHARAHMSGTPPRTVLIPHCTPVPLCGQSYSFRISE